MTAVLLESPGAVAADPPDESVAGHYGDPLREQRRLAEAAGVVDRSNRGVLRVSGPDRLGWLHSLTSQHLSDLAPWRAVEGLVLDPHGHVEHHFLATDDGEATWLEVEPGTAAALAAYLESMRFMLRVEVADVSDEWAVLSVVGPTTPDAVRALVGADVPAAPLEAAPLPEGGFVRRMPWPGPDAADLVVPRSAAAGLVAGSGVAVAGMWAFEAMRVESHRPRLGRETDHRTIPHELGWIGVAVHLDKGCYRGQETVARVHNLGKPPRRLVLLHFDGTQEELPPPGTPVELGGRQVGFLGTAVHHWELGPVALAVIKRNTADDARLVVAGMAAAAERVVDA